MLKRLPFLGLAAFHIGAVLSPWGFVAVGALRHFYPVFSAITVPPLFASTVFLLARYLGKRTAAAKPRSLLLALEALSWAVIAAFLALVSRFAFLTPFERVGTTATLFLIASVPGLLLVALRRTAIERRFEMWPPSVALAASLAILVAAAALVVVHAWPAPPPVI